MRVTKCFSCFFLIYFFPNLCLVVCLFLQTPDVFPSSLCQESTVHGDKIKVRCYLEQPSSSCSLGRTLDSICSRSPNSQAGCSSSQRHVTHCPVAIATDPGPGHGVWVWCTTQTHPPPPRRGGKCSLSFCNLNVKIKSSGSFSTWF